MPFCGNAKETIMHIVKECNALPEELKKPSTPQNFGPNFEVFGIAEIPHDAAKTALKVSDFNQIPYFQWNTDTNKNFLHVWVDGSVDDQSLFFHQKGGFAIENADGTKIDSGPVFHINLSAYTTELWAALFAFASSPQPIHIHSDCQSVVNQFQEVMQSLTVPFCWTRVSWWLRFRDIYKERLNLLGFPPIIIEWCKAHQVDQLQSHLITPDITNNLGTMVENLIGNKFADLFAKEEVAAQKISQPTIDCETKQSSVRWQLWLAKVNAWLGSTQSQKKEKEFPVDGNNDVK